MANKDKCEEAECENEAHARGLCKRHYGIAWRRERSAKEDPLGLRKVKFPRKPLGPKDRTPTRDALHSSYRALKKAQDAYDLVKGVKGRQRWRLELTKLKEEIKELESRMDPADVDVVKKRKL